MTRRGLVGNDGDPPVRRDERDGAKNPTGRASRDVERPARAGSGPGAPRRIIRPATKRARVPAAPVPETDPDPGDLFTHRYVVRLATTALDHDREITSILRAMGRKKWSVESRESAPGASSRETVTTLTFVQATGHRRTPNAPVPEQITKTGNRAVRRFGQTNQS